MTVLLASHSMPSLDELFGPLAIAAAVLCSGFVALLAACRGTGSVARLTWGRYLGSAASGLASGWTTLAAVSLAAVNWLPGMVAALVVFAMGSLAGAIVAHRVAARVASWMSWYTCRVCGVCFYSRAATERCQTCAAVQDEAGFSRALTDFADRYRELP
jgi:hypothetical protein